MNQQKIWLSKTKTKTKKNSEFFRRNTSDKTQHQQTNTNNKPLKA